MDTGLQQALDGLPEEVRKSMDRFATSQAPNSRMKLPLSLSAKDRKAVHLWAEMNRVEHLSFGYRGRRRLHLSVGEVPADSTPHDGDDDEDGDDSAEDCENEDWS